MLSPIHSVIPDNPQRGLIRNLEIVILRLSWPLEIPGSMLRIAPE
jgi:hypothetical protein